MNSTQAKQIPIENFLGRLNHKPVKTSGADLWYHSPLRQEDKTPSFKVNTILNTWYDFSYGEGGSIIDLLMTMYNEDVSGVLNRLSSSYGTVSPVRQFETVRVQKKPAESKLNLVGITDISEKGLYAYLKDRCIDVDIAKQYLKQIYFTITGNDNKCFALAMENDVGGYEFTNGLKMKGCIGHKAITSIKSDQNKNVVVFEGMMDFLSFLTHQNITDFQSSAIIMNSVAMKKETLQAFQTGGFKKVYLFLDNDNAGNEVKAFLASNLGTNVVDKSDIYHDYKDYNEYWVNLVVKDRE